MLLKITEKCSLGCSHCMNSATNSGQHMTYETLQDILKFISQTDMCSSIIISGGEPTEHPDFVKFINTILDWSENCNKNMIITIATNGFWFIDPNNKKAVDEIVNRKLKNTMFTIQVSTDRRFYPKRIDLTNPIFNYKRFVISDNCVRAIDYIGRAKDNNIHCNNKISSSCFNIRAISHQVKINRLKDLTFQLESRLKMCTPAIRINGDICLGESDHCPPASNIYKDESNIIQDIINFKCSKCECNNKLPYMYKLVLNNNLIN